MRRDLIIVLVLLLSSACARHSLASLPEAPGISEMTDPPAGCAAGGGSGTQSVITREELQGSRAPNLYDAIRKLRPAYFAIRGPVSIYNKSEMGMVVIVNRHVIGGLDELESMRVNGLFCVRRLSAADVALLTGMTALDGGIELVRAGEL